MEEAKWLTIFSSQPLEYKLKREKDGKGERTGSREEGKEEREGRRLREGRSRNRRDASTSKEGQGWPSVTGS